MDRAKPEDIVIDFDRLAVALAGPGADSHQHPKHLKDVTWSARSGAVTAALKLAERGHAVWLIHTQPSDATLARYRKAGAEVVTVDPGRDVVEERCRALRAPGSLTAVGRWYSAQAKAQVRGSSPIVTPSEDGSASAVTSRAW
jgi:hypothetical protein